MKPIIHAKGGHIIKLNPAWIWPPGSGDAEEAPPPTGGEPGLVDSCPIENQSDIETYGLTTAPLGTRAIFQAFTAPRDCTLASFKASLKKVGTPTGNLMLWVYNTTGAFPNVLATPGTGRPSLLFNTAGITDPNGQLCEFLFSGAAPVTLDAGVTYAIAVENHGTFSCPADSSIKVGFAGGGDAHPGNGGYFDGTWHADPNADMVFYLYEKEPEPPPESANDPLLEDCWPIEYKNDDGSYGFYGRQIAVSMSFTAKRGGVLDRAKVWMKRSEPLTLEANTFTAHIYETTKPIASATPEGASLAASDSVDGATFAPMLGDPVCEPVEFFFTGANQIQLVKDKVYCLVLQRAPLPLPEVTYDAYRCGFAHRIQPPMADGNYSHQTEDGVYSASFAYFDLIFYVYSLP